MKDAIESMSNLNFFFESNAIANLIQVKGRPLITILGVVNATHSEIAWRGAAGASFYSIEMNQMNRSDQWSTIAANVNDNQVCEII